MVLGGSAGWGAGCLTAPPLHPPSCRLELGGHPSLGQRAPTNAWALSADSAPIPGRSTGRKKWEKTLGLDLTQANSLKSHLTISIAHQIIRYAFTCCAEKNLHGAIHSPTQATEQLCQLSHTHSHTQTQIATKTARITWQLQQDG